MAAHDSSDDSQAEKRARLLSAYPFDYESRTEAERRELALAAAEDPELFDRLIELEPLRELLEQPGVMDDVKAALSNVGHSSSELKASKASRRFQSSTWALPAAASFLLGAVLGTTVIRRTQPAALDLVELSKAVTSAPVVTLQDSTTREAGGTSTRVLPVTFSTADTFVRVVVPVEPDPSVSLTTLEVTLKRGNAVVWQARTPVSYGDGRGTAVALVPVSLLSPGAELKLTVGVPGEPDPVEWQVEPNMK